MNIDEIMLFIDKNADNLEYMRRIRLSADKNIKNINSSLTSSSSVSKKVNTEAIEIAMALRTMVLENYPHLERSTDALKWAEDIDKMHRLDQISWQNIEGVMRWSQEDDFWKQQIRSGSNLRKHYDKMLVRIQSEPRRMEFIS
jgi:hypothetical protein